MRKLIVAGNWKMNKTFDEADELIATLAENIQDKDLKCQMIVCPPALYLEMATDYADESKLHVGAQNVSNHDSGAYTGEISPSMLASVDVEYCIVGHSERREYFGEKEDVLSEKVVKLLAQGIKPIYCCGEVKEQRENDSFFEVVRQQLTDGVFNLSADDFSDVVIAYEPVWAIGTGLTASPEQAQEMHAFIRSLISEAYTPEVAEETTILYGGSCNAGNAEVLFSQPDVDGGLIGGASLKADDFLKIALSF